MCEVICRPKHEWVRGLIDPDRAIDRKFQENLPPHFDWEEAEVVHIEELSIHCVRGPGEFSTGELKKGSSKSTLVSEMEGLPLSYVELLERNQQDMVRIKLEAPASCARLLSAEFLIDTLRFVIH